GRPRGDDRSPPATRRVLGAAARRIAATPRRPHQAVLPAPAPDAARAAGARSPRADLAARRRAPDRADLHLARLRSRAKRARGRVRPARARRSGVALGRGRATRRRARPRGPRRPGPDGAALGVLWVRRRSERLAG